MKRIFIVGPLFFGYSKSIAAAFEREGYVVDLFDQWVEGAIENFREKVIYNFTRDKEFFFKKKYDAFNRKVLDRYNAFQPDIVIVIRGAILNEDSLLIMKRSKLVLWMMDSVFLVKNTLRNISLYDHVFLFEKEDIAPLKEQHNIEGRFLPLALDEKVYYPIPGYDRPIDILFVGNLYEKRIALLNKMIKQFPCLNIKIYGYYFSKARNIKRYLFRKDKKQYTNKAIAPSDLNVLYNKTKICLNIHHDQSVYGVNQRFFEISGASAVQVCDRHGFIDDNFDPEAIFTYDTEEELFQRINNILADYSHFKNRSESIYKAVITQHTFHNRIKYILQHILPINELRKNS